MRAFKRVGLVLLLVGLMVALMGAGFVARDRFDWVIAKRLTVQYGGSEYYSDVDLNANLIENIGASGTDFDSNGGLTLAENLTAVDGTFSDDLVVADDVTITGTMTLGQDVSAADLSASDDLTVGDDATITDDATVGGDLTVSGNISGRALAVRLQDVADDATDAVLSATGVASGTATVSGGITNPDYPRNVTLSYQTTTTSTAGTLTISGVDARGGSTTEDIAVSAVSGTQSFTGDVPWASITSFTMPTTRTEAVTLTVGLGEKFGLPIVPVAAGDVFFVTENNAYLTAYTVNTTYGTLLPTADVVANDDFTIWIKQ